MRACILSTGRRGVRSTPGTPQLIRRAVSRQFDLLEQRAGRIRSAARRVNLLITETRFRTLLGAFTWICLTGCSSRPGDEPARAWADLFEVFAPVTVSDSTVSLLTRRWSDEQAARSGSRLGWVPISVLRSGQPDPVLAEDRGPEIATVTVSGEHLAASVSPIPRVVLETPYWTSWFRRLGAAGGGRAFVATNLVYPIFVYDEAGRLVDSLVSPPPSWKQARRPFLGEFLPSRQTERNTYFKSFTVLKALAVVSDSVLVVSHGRHSGQADDPYALVPTTVDVYVGRRRTATDLPSPGELVAYSKTSLFFLQRFEQASGATLTEYAWRTHRN